MQTRAWSNVGVQSVPPRVSRALGIRGRSPSRSRVAVLVAGLVLVSLFVPIAPAKVAAREPVPQRCQAGLMTAAAPKQDALCLTADDAGAVEAAAIVPGFQESVVWSGLTNPVAVRFAADGRVFVAEKSGVIKIFDSLTDPTPTAFSALTPAVHNFWDRGLLGFALDPSLTGGTGGTGSYLYVLYAYDHILGSSDPAPRWGDQCPGPPNGPGATTDGCVISGRLSRFAVSGTSVTGSEQFLIEDWCQQFPSHSAGSLVFGPDGALYVSGGDGASFNLVDYGQRGGTTSPVYTAKNPCGDPPGDAMTPPTAEGGALRSQDVRSNASGSAADYLSTVLASTPFAYWRLDEASGTVADDRIGSADGVYVNGPTLGIPGAIADGTTAVHLTAAEAEYVNMPSLTTIPSQLSIESWINSGGSAISDVGIAGWYQSDTLKSALYWASTTELRFSSTSAGNPPLIVSGLSQLASGWHHVVGTYDGTNARLYLDGSLIAGPTPRTLLGGASSSFKVGQYGTLDGTYPNASFDDTALYQRALSATEVAAHYAARSGGGGGDPVGLDGTVLRVNPATGAGMPGNPFASSLDVNARRIIAYGLRNPFRITFRPGTNELWVGDVGWTAWEELNRIPNATDAVADNFGWPCYEGAARHSGYDSTNLSLCESLYSAGAGAIVPPYYTYNHSSKIAAEACPTGGSSITGVAFYPESGGSYPASYAGGVFFADHTRNCIWFMPKGTNGQPDPNQILTFIDGALNPVDLVMGPGNDLFYVDFEGGAIRRVTFSAGNQPPTALIAAVPTSGAAPLTVQFDGSGSSDPEGGALTYAWDLDGDGAYDDATGATTSWTYPSPGTVTVGLRVVDVGSASGTDTQLITVGNSPPVPVISTPTVGTTWSVGDVVSFSGSASDPQDGSVPAASLSWTAAVVHCAPNCHTHPPFFTLAGEASGSFSAPDHGYPSSIEITLTATDSNGTSASVKRSISAQGVDLTFQTSPPGLSIAVNDTSGVAPFTRTVIVGSTSGVTTISPQTLNGITYVFTGWSDGGAQTHAITGPASPTTYTATFQATGFAVTPVADAHVRANQANKNFGTATTMRIKLGEYRAYLKFTVTGLSGPASNARLRLWVAEGGTSGGSVYAISNTTWAETGITWNNAPAITGTAIATAGTVTTGTWIEFNLGTLVTGNGTYTFAISNGNSNAVDYATRESANDPALVITP